MKLMRAGLASLGCRVLLALLCCMSTLVRAEPLLWQVDHPESGGRAYLFGSVHFGSPGLYPLPDSVERTFSESEELVVELDIAAVAPNLAAEVMRKQGRYLEGGTLYQHLDERSLGALADICVELGLPIAAFENLKPWLVAVQITAFQMRRAGFDDKLGIDRHFIERVKRGHSPGPKSLVELETFEQQLSLFSALTDEEQAHFLAQTLRHFEAGPVLLKEILNAWKQGDANQLDALIKAGFSGDPLAARLYRLVYTQRNANMSVQLEQMLSDGRKLFVVVGAGHMVGEDGLVSLLRKQGARVKLINAGS